MNLEYISETGAFVLKVPRSNAAFVKQLMREHGWDMSLARSTASHAVMFTNDPYAACAFWHLATPAAKAELGQLYAQIEASWKVESKAHIRVPIDCELWPFQKAGVEYALKRTHTLIGDQPGLGKTNQAIAIANEMSAKRVLVICPANIRLQWVKRIREWTTLPWPYTLHPVLRAGHGVHPNAHYTVISYDLASSPDIAVALARQTYDLLILDEVHMLKTSDSKRTQAIFGGGKDRLHPPLADRAAAIVALSGTPLPNRPREAYTIAKALDWGSIDFANETAFRDRYNPSATVRSPYGNVIATDERTGRHYELGNRMRSHFMVRREKHGPRGVMAQLELPVYDIVQLEETKAVKLALEAESLLAIDPEQLEGADAVTLGHISEVRKLMGVALAPQVADYANMLIDGGQDKLVIFGWHKEVLTILQNKLDKHGLVRIDGSVTPRARQHAVDRFVGDKNVKIIIGNMLAMGVGTDGLQQVCNHCLAGDTIVVTNHGRKPIVGVTTDDLVWDGQTWVRHEGLIYQGVQPTVSVGGVRTTKDHRVLVQSTMIPVSTILRDGTLSQALATGSASLLSLSLSGGRWAASSGLLCDVTVADRPTMLEKIPSTVAWRRNAGLVLREGTIKTGGQSWPFNKNWQNFEPVFDLVNAGPRHRFTVLTPDGQALVVSNCLIAEPDWVPGNNIQAVDRLDRGGQKRKVQADIFVAPGSFAEKILASALRKMRTIHSTLDHQMSDVLG